MCNLGCGKRKSGSVGTGMSIPEIITTTFTGDLSVNYTFNTNTTTMEIKTSGGVKFQVEETRNLILTGISMNLTNVNEANIVFSTATRSFNTRVSQTRGACRAQFPHKHLDLHYSQRNTIYCLDSKNETTLKFLIIVQYVHFSL